MSGTSLGFLKGKLGLRGPTKSGDMIKAMNFKMKSHSSSALSGLRRFVKEEENEKKKPARRKLGSRMEPAETLVHHKCKTCGAMYKTSSDLHAHMKSSHKYKKGGMKKKIKKTGKSFGKSNSLGGGGRFRQVEHAVAGKKGVYNPAGLAAYIGRRSLGKSRFQSLAAAGRKH